MDNINCIFCNIPSDIISVEENGYQAKECPKCGLVYISPRPERIALKELYQHDRAHVSARGHFSDIKMPRLHELHHLKIIKKFKSSGALLEIGPGAGTFLEEAKKKGFNVFAVEPNPLQAKYIENKLNITCQISDICNASFCENTFDIIYHRDVTSHFYDPIASFKKMHSLLKDDGILVFETGFYGSPKYMPLFLNHQFPDHLFTFSEKSIRNLLDKAGFSETVSYVYSSVPMLFFKKLIHPIIDSVKKNKTRGGTSSKLKKIVYKESVNQEYSKFLIILKRWYFRICHFLMYHVGYLSKKSDRPRKILLVARKMVNTK
ncbi:MAG: class I SAM-dependent methyltransferase [Candidatus Omnitrophica bacterium]|nr:class I SAM-dependent methyltransferase [Candidatus Omnitrophota bacterium]